MLFFVVFRHGGGDGAAAVVREASSVIRTAPPYPAPLADNSQGRRGGRGGEKECSRDISLECLVKFRQLQTTRFMQKLKKLYTLVRTLFALSKFSNITSH